MTITGTDFTGASAVHFGASQATGVSVVNATQITATSPAGAGIADVTVTTPSGTSATSAADQFTYQAAKIPPPPSSPVVLTGAPSVHGSSAAALEGSVDPQGLATTAHYEYGLDSKFRASAPVYDQSTPSQNVGSDFSSHTVVASLSGLVPNALYHVRLVATNSAGTTFGPDATFTTKEDPPPPPPKLGGSFNAEPVKGLVFVEINGKFIPITEVRQIPNGAIINALHGTVELITSTGGSTSATASQAAKAKSKNQSPRSRPRRERSVGPSSRSPRTTPDWYRSRSSKARTSRERRPTRAARRTAARRRSRRFPRRRFSCSRAATTTESSAPKAGMRPRPFAERSGRPPTAATGR